MLAFLTPRRRATLWMSGAVLITACATYVDQLTPPAGDVAGSAGSGGSAGASAGAQATAGAGTAAGGGTAGGVPSTGGSSGSASAGSDASMAGEGGATGGAGTEPVGGTSVGGTTAGGGAGGTSGGGGTGGTAGTSGGGAGGKGGTGGSSGSGGSGGATQNCSTNPIPAKSGWTATASSNQSISPPKQAIDGDVATRWSSGKDQAGTEWFQVDFGTKVTLSKVTLMLGMNTKDYPRKYSVRVSDTANNMNAPVLVSGMGAEATDTVITFPAKATGRYLLITQGGTATGLWWSIAELQAECAN